MKGGQGEAGPYLALVLQVKRERNIGEAVVGRQKVFEFRTVCCSGSQLHIIIGVNPKVGVDDLQSEEIAYGRKGTMMSRVEGRIRVRPMVVGDIDAVLAVDRAVRAAGKAITYANLTTEYILSMDRGVAHEESPTSYADSITGNVVALLDFSFVAEVGGQVRGFILGQIAHLREAATEFGVIQMIGVHPDYQRKRIGISLLNALADKYRSRGIKTMRVGVDYRDKDLRSLIEHMGFGVGRLVVYSKIL